MEGWLVAKVVFIEWSFLMMEICAWRNILWMSLFTNSVTTRCASKKRRRNKKERIGKKERGKSSGSDGVVVDVFHHQTRRWHRRTYKKETAQQKRKQHQQQRNIRMTRWSTLIISRIFLPLFLFSCLFSSSRVTKSKKNTRELKW